MRFLRAALAACAFGAIALGPGAAKGQEEESTPSIPAPPAAAPGLSEPPPARQGAFVIDMGYDWGSTELLEIELTDGTTQTLSANAGFWMSAGAAFLRRPVGGTAAIDTVATLGFKYKSIGADNGSFRYLAFPLEVMERITAGPMRFGAGFSLALLPSLKGDGVLADIDIDLKNSLGIVFRVDVIGNRPVAQRGWFAGARFVWQKLEGENGIAPVDANAVGIAAGFEL